MADVRLTIAGRSYDVNCSDGQEQQLLGLAAMVDEKARAIVGTTEARQLLFATLMLADELQEARAAAPQANPDIDRLEADLSAAQMREAELRAYQAELQATLVEASIEINNLTDAAGNQAQALTAAQSRLAASEAEAEQARAALGEALTAAETAQAALMKAATPALNPAPDPAHGRALSQIADRIELLAEKFEQLS